jgi:hypothetical protein
VYHDPHSIIDMAGSVSPPSEPYTWEQLRGFDVAADPFYRAIVKGLTT